MRTATNALELRRPKTIHDALGMLRDDPALIPMAGCTDLYVALNFGTLPGTTFLDLWPLERLRRINVKEDVLEIGALTTYSELIASRRVARWLPMLIAAAREIGGPQIQNRGTLGGNIANGSPAGDSLPVLAAADATIVLRSATDARRVKLTEFYTGYRTSVRRADELILAVEIPRQHGKQWFRKVGTRAAQAISKVVMAAIRDDREGPRIAIGSVAATVVRVPRTEAALASDGIDAGARALAQEIHPIDDARSTADYRRTVCANLLRRFWSDTAP